jgi:hypothetical protein
MFCEQNNCRKTERMIKGTYLETFTINMNYLKENFRDCWDWTQKVAKNIKLLIENAIKSRNTIIPEWKLVSAIFATCISHSCANIFVTLNSPIQEMNHQKLVLSSKENTMSIINGNLHSLLIKRSEHKKECNLINIIINSNMYVMQYV